MPVASLNGINIYYEDHGSGFPLVMTHGYSSSSRAWAGQIPEVTQRYRLITWDMRGHGQTDSPEEQEAYNEANTVEDLYQLLKLLGVERAVIGGLSLGGYMSLAFHLAHPEMVQALLLCDTGPGYRNDQARATWNETAFRTASRYEERGLDALGRSAEVQAARSTHRSAAGLAKAARGMLAQFDARVINSLEQIAVPTLLIVGANDQAYLNPIDYMEKKIPGARKVVVADAGHSVNIDQPEIFNQVVLEFLDGVTRG